MSAVLARVLAETKGKKRFTESDLPAKCASDAPSRMRFTADGLSASCPTSLVTAHQRLAQLRKKGRLVVQPDSILQTPAEGPS